MKKIFLIIVLIFTIAVRAQKQDVKKTIKTFFVAFNNKDTAKIKSICANKMILQTIQENSTQAQLTNVDITDFLKSISAIGNDFKFNEQILSYSIQIDGTMAHVWAPYRFYINNKLSHKGVNTFTLFKENEIWKIIYLIDTRRK